MGDREDSAAALAAVEQNLNGTWRTVLAAAVLAALLRLAPDELLSALVAFVSRVGARDERDLVCELVALVRHKRDSDRERWGVRAAIYCDACGVELDGPRVCVEVHELAPDGRPIDTRRLRLCATHGPSAAAVEAWLAGWATNIPPGPATPPHEAAVTLVSRELGGTATTVLAASVLAGLLRVAPIALVDELTRLVSRHGDTDDRELVQGLMELVHARRIEQGARIGDDAVPSRTDAAPAEQGAGWWEP